MVFRIIPNMQVTEALSHIMKLKCAGNWEIERPAGPQRHMGQHAWTYICILGCACVLPRWQEGRQLLGEARVKHFVDQSQGQGYCRGPGSRWMKASDGSSLAGCSFSTGPHQPNGTKLHHSLHLFPPFLSIGTCPENDCPLGSILGLAQPTHCGGPLCTCWHVAVCA